VRTDTTAVMDDPAGEPHHRHIACAVSFVELNTLTIALPTLSSGPQNLSIAKPTGEGISIDAAWSVN
jgi:hypothetical protein